MSLELGAWLSCQQQRWPKGWGIAVQPSPRARASVPHQNQQSCGRQEGAKSSTTWKYQLVLSMAHAGTKLQYVYPLTQQREYVSQLCNHTFSHLTFHLQEHLAGRNLLSTFKKPHSWVRIGHVWCQVIAGKGNL